MRSVRLLVLISLLFGFVSFIDGQTPQGEPRFDASLPAQLESQETVRVLIRFSAAVESGASLPAQAERLTRMVPPGSLEIRRQLGRSSFIAAEIDQQAFDALIASDTGVEIYPDEQIFTLGNGSTLDFMDAPSLAAQGITGEGVVVAILDAGVNPGYEGAARIEERVIAEACFTNGACENGQDTGSSSRTTADHGMQVAEVFVGENGYAPDVELVMLKVVGDEGAGFVSDWLAGIDWVLENRAQFNIDLVNISLGTSVLYGVCNINAFPVFQEAHDLLVQLSDSGVTTFIASGNQGSPNQSTAPACLNGADDGIVTVGATYVDHDGRVPRVGTYQDSPFGAFFSDCADDLPADPAAVARTIACFSNLGTENLDLVAPGVFTDRAGNEAEYTTLVAGTSFASPVAAAVGALVRQQAPGVDLETYLPQSALQLPSPQPNDNRVFKLVNAQQAIANLPLAVCQLTPTNFAELEAALRNVNARTICLDAAQTYTAPLDSLATFPITRDVEVRGNNALIRGIGTLDTTLFDIASQSTLNLTNLIFADMNVSGADTALMAVQGDLVVQNVTFRDLTLDDTAHIVSALTASSVTMADVRAENNIQRADAGLMRFDRGAAISITGSSFIENAGGILKPLTDAFGTTTTIQIRNSDFLRNSVAESGATTQYTVSVFEFPIYANAALQFVRVANSLSSLAVIDNAGSLTINDGLFAGNAGTLADYRGSVIRNRGEGVLTVVRTRFIDNTTQNVPIIASESVTPLSILRATFQNNTVVLNPADALPPKPHIVSIEGAEDAFGTPSINATTFYENVLPADRAIVQTSSGLAVTNSTFSAHPNNPAIASSGAGAAVEVQFSTFFNNRHALVSGGTALMANSLLDSVAESCLGSITFTGRSFATDDSCIAPAVTLATASDLGLQPLADYGGETPTHALRSASRAIDAATDCTLLLAQSPPTGIDQRGNARDAFCDAGAFEFDEAPTDDYDGKPDLFLIGIDSDNYAYEDDPGEGSLESEREADICNAGEVLAASDDDLQSYHVNMTGWGNAFSYFNGWGNAFSYFNGWGNAFSYFNGSIYYAIAADAADQDSVLVAVAEGFDVQSLQEVACGDDQNLGDLTGPDRLILEIPQQDFLSDYGVIVYRNQATGEALTLEIELATFSSCATVDSVPTDDCNALVEFFETTGGRQWEGIQWWANVRFVCDWEGVTCSNGDSGEVIDLNVPAQNLYLPAEYDTQFAYFEALRMQEDSNNAIRVNTVINRIADDSVCSLAEAIENANAGSQIHEECDPGLPGPDTIRLLTDQTFTFNGPLAEGMLNGLPPITSEITIEGRNATLARAEGGQTLAFRFFEVRSGGDLTLQDLTLFNGSADRGGALLASGSVLRTENVILRSNTATGAGGALFLHNDAAASLNATRFETNESAQVGGAVAVDDGQLTISGSEFRQNSAAQNGGALHLVLRADATITDTTFAQNRTTAGAGGALRMAAIDGQSPTLSLIDVLFSDNRAGTTGGAVQHNGGTLQVEASVFSDNRASSGGAVYNEATLNIASSEFRRNAATNFGGSLDNHGQASVTDSLIRDGQARSGAGIANHADLQVSASLLQSNAALQTGGAIFNRRSLLLEETRLESNQATAGGGWWNDHANDITSRASDNTFYANEATAGAGAFILGGTVLIERSTFDQNSGGGLSVGGEETAPSVRLVNTTWHANTASAVQHQNGNVRVVFSTFLNNVAGGNVGAAIASDATSAQAALRVQNNLFVTPNGGNCSSNGANALISEGYNVLDDATCGTPQATDRTNVTLTGLLLSQNGGPTATVALAVGSLPVDLIPLNACNGVLGPLEIEGDQRGVVRGIDACDAGAFELGATVELRPDIAFMSGGAATPGSTVDVRLSVANQSANAAQNVVLTQTIPDGVQATSADCAAAGGTLTCDLRSVAGGTTGVANVQYALAANLMPGKIAFAYALAENGVTITTVRDDLTVYADDPAANHLIRVDTSTQGIADDGACSLAEAIQSANDDAPVFTSGGECAGGQGVDTIRLGVPGAYTFTQALSGFNALPVIRSQMVLDGDGATLRRDLEGDGAPFRFTVIEGDGDLTTLDITFENGRVPNGDGGALLVRGTLRVEAGTVFRGNQARRGGAVYNESSALHIAGATFDANQVTTFGGALYHGGASALTIRESAFTFNQATVPAGVEPCAIGDLFCAAATAGGAIYDASTAETILSATTFETNRTTDGGAIHRRPPSVADDRAVLRLEDVTFRSNEARYGAALQLVGGLTRISGDTRFENNQSDAYGGALHLVDGQLRVSPFISEDATQVTFRQNIAGLGGALYIAPNTRAQLANARFRENLATVDILNPDLDGVGTGGAIYNAGTLDIGNDTVFEGNLATADGGAIAHQGSSLTVSRAAFVNNPRLRVQDRQGVIFSGNQSGSEGGAVFSDAPEAFITATRFTDNFARRSGGAIAQTKGTLTLANALLSQNRAGNEALGGNTQPAGGAIALRGTSSTLTVANTTFYRNAAGGIIPTEFGGTQRIDGLGGALAAFDGALTVTNITMSQNTAFGSTPRGGGLHMGATATATLANSLISGNTRSTLEETFRDECSGVDINDTARFNLFGFANDPAGCIGFGTASDNLIPPDTLAAIVADILETSPGAPTATLALPNGSPAIDAGNNALLPDEGANDFDGDGSADNPADSDQRAYDVAFPRVNESGVDIGAFESGVVEVPEETVEITMRLVDGDGNPLAPESLEVDDSFFLEVHCTDLRENQAVYSCYTDIEYDPDALRIDDIIHDSDYAQATSGSIDPSAGLIDEVGGTSDSLFAPPASTLVVTLQATALRVGETTLATNPAEGPFSEIVIYGVGVDQRPFTIYRAFTITVAGVVSVFGDANSDGIVGPADAMYIRNRLGTADAALDINEDGQVTEADVFAVLGLIGE